MMKRIFDVILRCSRRILSGNKRFFASLRMTVVCGMLVSILSGFVAAPPSVNAQKAIFAGGCFWCMQPPYDKEEGVIETVVGYSGGETENPNYESVSSGTTGHFEVVEVTYDPAKISYERLLEVYWKNIDPLNADGQFCDVGKQYKTAIFYVDEEQRVIAENSKTAIEEKMSKSFATEILPAKAFYPAEEHHQKYYLKNPVRYNVYKAQCQRDKRLGEVWGK